MLLAFLILNGVPMAVLAGLPCQERPSVQDSGERASRQVEQDYAAREHGSDSLEEFRGGGGEELIYAPILAIGIVVLIGKGIVELAKAIF
jgi:hypothetical protein